MGQTAFAVALVGLYAVATLWLSVKGMRRTKNLRSFAIGSGDMSPTLVGITLSSSVASTATFVINPGFVYADGLAAFMHYGPAASAGSITALLLLSHGFQRIGSDVQALTLPDWVRKRYGSPALGRLFAVLTLLYVTFLVLILSGSALILAQMFDLPYQWALVGLLVFVFGYILMGGTYAHAYTNALQGLIMLVVAAVVFLSGVHLLGPGFLDRLASIDQSLAGWVNPRSVLYNGVFSAYISAFVITFALMLQPHILTKVLYIQKSEQMGRFLAVAIGTGLVFSLMLFVGFYARLGGVEVERQDLVVITYLQQTFGGMMNAVLFVALLAAGMSTLDGILVSVSSIVVNDLVLGGADRSEARMAKGLAWSRYALVAIGLVVLALSWNPPRLLGLFAQQGVYGLVAAAAAPFILGVLRPQFRKPSHAGALALLGVGIHFGLFYGIDSIQNPSISAAWGILISTGLGFVLAAISPSEVPSPAAKEAELSSVK